MTPERIARYEIIRELGHDGMAIVYLAHDSHMKRQVAIKVLPHQLTFDPKFRARFHREAEAIATLEHPGIVPVYEYGEQDEQPYIVMRYLPGGSLADRLTRSALPPAEAARIISRLARALDKAHARGIIHRDLKPGNILFDEDGDSYISDFGIAKVVETTTSLTHGLVGTPAYMSPEQFDSETAVDGRSDIYALGIILFEMLTGQHPYRADTPAQWMKMHLLSPVPNIRQMRGDLPPECEAIIARAMAKDRDERFRTAGELAQAVNRLAKPSAVTRRKPLPPARKPATADETTDSTDLLPPPQRKLLPRALWIGLVVAAVLIIGMVGGGWAISAFGHRFTASPMPDALIRTDTAAHTISSSSAPTIMNTPTHTPLPSNTPIVAPTLAPTIGIGTTTVSEVDGMVMAFVPAGEFLMGASNSDANVNPDERRQHIVYIDDLWIDQTEVSVGMFTRFAGAVGYQTDAERSGGAYIWNGGGWDFIGSTNWRFPNDPARAARDEQPVTQVSWNDAAAYCAWAGRRLPTEAEWEKVARGATGSLYPWGNTPPDSTRANYADLLGDTSAVTSYPAGANGFGVLNLAGNVYEWVADWYGKDYYSISPARNPQGPASGKYRVMRGGSWQLGAPSLRAFVREVSEPQYMNNNVGFRCSRSP